MSGSDLSLLSDDELLAELVRRRNAESGSDVHEAETRIERACEAVNRDVLERWLQHESEIFGSGPRGCPRCGRSCGVRARARERVMMAVAGEVRFRRDYHYCSACKQGFYPFDAHARLPEGGDVTPEMERRLLDFGVHDTFAQAASRWSVHHPQRVSENLIRRVVERQGRALVAADPEVVQRAARPHAPVDAGDTLVVQVDGGMVPTRGPGGWKEAKVAVAWRVGHHLSHREAPRGMITQARYAAHLGGIPEFSRRTRALLAAEHARDAKSVVWVGDGAPWVWKLAEELCPRAVQILDWYHAIEAASDAAKVLFGATDPCVGLFVKRVVGLLKVGDHAELVRELESCMFVAEKGAGRAALEDLRRYYGTHAARMDYPRFEAQGWTIGSGVVEAANKHVIQARMDRAGQHWDPQRGDRMACLRAVLATAGAEWLYGALQATRRAGGSDRGGGGGVRAAA